MYSPASRVKTMWRRERRATTDATLDAMLHIDALRDGSDLEAIREFYIDPRCAGRTRWDRASCALVLYNVAILPFDAAFWSDVDTGAVRVARAIGYVIDAFFAVDIALNFFTAYYDASERLVARRRDIVMHYLRTSFAMDVLGSFPFELLVHGSSTSLAAIVKFPRLLRMRRVYSFLEKKESRSVLLFRIAQLAGAVLLAIHFVACAWFMICASDRGESVDGISDDGEVFWCNKRELTTASRYLFATHDAVSFLLGNGVGDGMDRASVLGAETIILLTCGVLYCIVFGNVASLVNSLMSRNEAFRSRMNAVNDAMRYMQVDDDLSNRVRQYYEYLWLRYRDVKVGSMAIAHDLPQSLKHELLLHFHSEVLRRVPMFANIKEPSTVLMIVNKLKMEIALPGDLLIRRGEPSRGLFFLNRGSVEVLLYVSPDVAGKARLASTSDGQTDETSPTKRPRRLSRQTSAKISDVTISDKNPILRDGDYFGERGILLGDVPLASVLARTFCELHVLTTEDFESILELAPEIEEYMIRARLELFSECDPKDAKHSAAPGAVDAAEETMEDVVRRQLTLTRAIRRERLDTDTRAGEQVFPRVNTQSGEHARPRTEDAPQTLDLARHIHSDELSTRLDRIESALADLRRSSRVVRKL